MANTTVGGLGCKTWTALETSDYYNYRSEEDDPRGNFESFGGYQGNYFKDGEDRVHYATYNDYWAKKHGDNNFCRNKLGFPGGVWCFTTEADILWDFCPVPFCKHTSKMLDLSHGNGKPQRIPPHATMETEYWPTSFTICISLMVEAWTPTITLADLFTLKSKDGVEWIRVHLSAALETETLYELFFFSGAGSLEVGRGLIATTPRLLFPLQCTTC